MVVYADKIETKEKEKLPEIKKLSTTYTLNEHTCTSILLPCSCISSETEVFHYYTLFSHSFNHLFYSVKERSAVKSQLFLSTKNAWLDVITFQVHFLPLILLKSSICCFNYSTCVVKATLIPVTLKTNFVIQV